MSCCVEWYLFFGLLGGLVIICSIVVFISDLFYATDLAFPLVLLLYVCASNIEFYIFSGGLRDSSGLSCVRPHSFVPSPQLPLPLRAPRRN